MTIFRLFGARWANICKFLCNGLQKETEKQKKYFLAYFDLVMLKSV